MSKNTDLSELINYVKGKTTGQLVAPSYTSATSFTGTIAGYLGFDSSGNILTASGGSQWTTSGSDIYYNTGNVGIGTANPTAMGSYRILEVQNATGGIVRYTNTSAQGGYIAGNSGGLTYDTLGAFPHIFYTNGIARMTIANSGNVSIGTTDSAHPLVIASASTSFTLKLIGSASLNRSLIMFYPNTGLGAGYASIGADATSFFLSATNTSYLDLGGWGSGSLAIRIIANSGRVLIGTTTDNGAYLLQVNSQIWATNSTIATSDGRLKENINDLNPSLNLLMGIKARTFSYKENTEYNFSQKGITIGFIAQELKEVLKDTPYADSIVVEAGKYYGVAYEKIIPLLVKSIQELKTEVDILKAKNQ